MNAYDIPSYCGEGKLMPEIGGANISDFESGWNSAELDFIRMHEILKFIDMMAIRVQMRQSAAFEGYFAGVCELWRNLRPLCYPQVRKSMDDMKDDIQVKIDQWLSINDLGSGDEMFDRSLARQIEALHMECIAMRQVLGIGIPTRRRYDKSPEARLKMLEGS